MSPPQGAALSEKKRKVYTEANTRGAMGGNPPRPLDWLNDGVFLDLRPSPLLPIRPTSTWF